MDTDRIAVGSTRPEGGRSATAAAAFFLLPSSVFLLLFYFYPLASILKLGLAPHARLDLSPLASLGDAYLYRVLGFTAWQAALSTVLTLAAGLPAAYLVARYQFRGKALLRAELRKRGAWHD